LSAEGGLARRKEFYLSTEVLDEGGSDFLKLCFILAKPSKWEKFVNAGLVFFFQP